MRTFAPRILLLASLSLSATVRASAQTVAIRISEEETGIPIPGAFVSLLDADGRVLRSALTNGDGRFLFRTPGPGTYQIKAEMIGRETRFSAPLTLRGTEAGSTRLALPIHAIPLEELRVEADERCRLRPDEASEISRVWEEARKALAIQTWTEAEEMYRFRISNYDRDLDRRGRKVETERRRETTAEGRTPIGSLPAADLMSKGFIRPLEDGGYQYYGPDASVLLSDLFLDTHCLRLTRDRENRGSIGLAFEPMREDEVPEIRGTLWLDQRTANLRFLEYGYTWAPHEVARDVAGGRVNFHLLPNGAWIVNRWWIRVPVLAEDRDRRRRFGSGIWLAGIRETGGEVTEVSTVARETIAEAPRGTLVGVAWDSTLARPLEGATISLSGTDYSIPSNSNGEFRIEKLPQGVFNVELAHPRLNELGLSLSGVEVQITPGDTSRIYLTIPSTGSLSLAACRAEEREEGASVLTGVVREQRSGESIPGASVRLEWQEILATIPTVRARERWFEVSTDGDGRYTACGVPVDEALVVQASFLGIRGDTAHLRFLQEDFRVKDLEVELPPGLLSSREEALTLKEGVGVQGVQGVLLDRRTGEPVRTAEVTLRQSPGSVVVTGATDRKGFFRLQTPVPGHYLLSAEALGFSQVRGEEVEVTMGRLSVLEIKMAPEALALEPLVISAAPRAFHLEMQGFYDRKTKGLDSGIFMPPEFLEERQPRRLTDLFFEIPGTRVLDTAVGGRGVYFRSGERFTEICWPMVYVDRHLISTGGFLSVGAEPRAIDDLVPATDVAAVEVYRSPAEIPPEFNGPNAGCGVVVIWTRRGGGL